MEYELHLQYTCKGIDRKANGMSSIKKEEDRTECCLCGNMVLVKDYDYHIERECIGVSSAEKKPQRYQNKTVDDILKESAFGIQDKIEKEEEVISISSDDDEGDNKKRKKRKIIDDEEDEEYKPDELEMYLNNHNKRRGNNGTTIHNNHHKKETKSKGRKKK